MVVYDTNASVQLNVLSFPIILVAPWLSEIIISQERGRFVNMIVPLLWNWKDPTRKWGTRARERIIWDKLLKTFSLYIVFS